MFAVEYILYHRVVLIKRVLNFCKLGLINKLSFIIQILLANNLQWLIKLDERLNLLVLNLKASPGVSIDIR